MQCKLKIASMSLLRTLTWNVIFCDFEICCWVDLRWKKKEIVDYKESILSQQWKTLSCWTRYQRDERCHDWVQFVKLNSERRSKSAFQSRACCLLFFIALNFCSFVLFFYFTIWHLCILQCYRRTLNFWFDSNVNAQLRWERKFELCWSSFKQYMIDFFLSTLLS